MSSAAPPRGGAALVAEVTAARPERVVVDLLVAPFFGGESPLRGAAGRIDWRLCGLLSERLVEGRLSGEPGEATLVAKSQGLRSAAALLLGLGARAAFGPDEIGRAARDAITRALRLGARHVGFVLPGEGAIGLVAERRVAAAVRGAAEAVAEDGAPLRLVLIVAPGEVGPAARVLADFARRPGAIAVPLRAAASRAPEVDPAHPEGATAAVR